MLLYGISVKVTLNSFNYVIIGIFVTIVRYWNLGWNFEKQSLKV